MGARSRHVVVMGMALAVALTACVQDTPSVTPTAMGRTQSGTREPSLESTPSPAGASSSGPAQELINSPQSVVTDLQAPWSVAFRDGVPLVSERDSGRILEVAGDGSTREVAVIEEVAARGEGGLLGLAVDTRGRLYVYYTSARDNRIVRFDVRGTGGALSLGEPEVILSGVRKSTTHNGGRIAFGPDGMLYSTTGDAGASAEAQDPGSLSGKILRMTPDGGVPPGNPFDGSLVWSFGHRNPQGIAWGDDGTMYATEFGQNTWDELNIIRPGKNYGWPVVEGIAGHSDYVDPVQQWSPGDASPSGMAHLDGTLYIGNLRGQVLRTVPVADASTSSVYWAGTYGRLRDVAVTPQGGLWVITNNTDGRGTPAPGDDRIMSIPPEALVG